MADHYFTDTPTGADERRTLEVRLAGRDVEVVTATGVFSGGHVDLGTRVLLREVPALPAEGDLLDLGCGWGPLALAMALQSPAATVWAVDVNERALALTRENAERLGCRNVRAVTPEQVPDDVRFAALWSNPPIRIGKQALHDLLQFWLPRLTPDGEAHLVVQRNLGADSLTAWLGEAIPAMESRKVASAKGFRVIRTTHR
ncbi:methyltransferase [Angustibacter speluncae]